MKVDWKNILTAAAVAAIVTIAIDFVLPLKQDEDGNLKRINL